jgi:hypothetical protein
MSKGNRPATGAVSNKRLRAKSWYYRDGRYFYSKRVWLEAREKLAEDTAKAKEKAKDEAQTKMREGAKAKPAEGAQRPRGKPKGATSAQGPEPATTAVTPPAKVRSVQGAQPAEDASREATQADPQSSEQPKDGTPPPEGPGSQEPPLRGDEPA